ncbi:MAG TPA: aldo/keto reductase [Nitrososphaeraceae archaeon]|nr:aldo/keto reductase [Nitrososphaeraceae archaeon]
MIWRKFGWSDDKVPVIGQGTWMIDGDSVKESRAIETLRLGLEQEMSHIDTAEMYGNGHVEELVAEAIEGRRDKIFLVSKVLPYNASYEGTLKACKKSLKRLKTEWLDLYLLHWPSSYPIRETMRAMEKLVSDGLVKYIGVSNFDVKNLVEAEQVLQNERIACIQVLYNLRDRGIERQLLPYCINKGIAVVGYSPFGHGNFPSSESVEGNLLTKIGQKYNRTPKQVALNFLTRFPSTFTIPKTTIPESMKENSGGVGWCLKEYDLHAIDRAFPLPPLGTRLGVI